MLSIKKVICNKEENIRRYLREILSKSEIEICILCLLGKTNKEVAEVQHVAEKTVKFHLTNIYKKLKITNRGQILLSLPLDLLLRETIKKKSIL